MTKRREAEKDRQTREEATRAEGEQECQSKIVSERERGMMVSERNQKRSTETESETQKEGEANQHGEIERTVQGKKTRYKLEKQQNGDRATRFENRAVDRICLFLLLLPCFLQLLLEHGAPWNAVDRKGRCAGNYAVKAEFQDIIDRLVNAGE